ncbi:MAG: tRNA pseudouridine(55) synthase TruB [Gammaproteobacteria bacterium]|nr:tRNA pseudouridine(55) synthase TruB [Gammaproteobacteria bacterium]MCY4357464.1 tRNA pseudouridine(55) synthase TruB [Gammaproteobacteria bacterium]
MQRGRKNKGRAIDGIVLLDKPAGLTSNAALQQVKTLYEAAKAGHTGSLDPLATGVLPLCLGEATKVSGFLLESDKQYLVRVKLGQRTDTGDSEGSVIESADASGITLKAVQEALEGFRGEIDQVPSMYSAIKKDGVPLYRLARKGVEVERKARTVTVFSLNLLSFKNQELELDIACSKGTYIRTIADDLGQELGCGAHVVALRRVRVGEFNEQYCITIDALQQTKDDAGFENLDRFLIPMDEALGNLPEVRLPPVTADCVRHGQAVVVRHLPASGLVRLYEEEQFIGIGNINDDGKVAPRRLVVNGRN